MNKFYVYFIETLDGRVYVGYTSSPEKRWKVHQYRMKSKTHFNLHIQKIFDEFGEDYFEFKVFEEYPTEQEARDREEYWISYFLDNALDLSLNIQRSSCGGDTISEHPNRDLIVQKMTASLEVRFSSLSPEERKEKYGKLGARNGMFGRTHTKEVREKCSKMHLGNTYCLGKKASPETRAKISAIAKARTGDKNPFFGRVHTEEFKKNMSEKMKGRLPPNTAKVSCDGVIYQSAAEAARVLGVCPGTILFRLKSKHFPTFFKITQEMPNDHPERE